MKIKQLLIAVIILIAATANGQNTIGKDFEKFANHQDSLFVKAYDNRDVKTYDKLLTEFLSNYNKLSDPLKKTYTIELINAYYNLCCTYSIMGNKEMAFTYLKKSIEAGNYDYIHIMQDKDLDNIRNEKEFKILIETVRKVGDYPYILKSASKYDFNDKRPLPAFTYTSVKDSSLVDLRKRLKLDSIAGTGDDILKVINILHWLHNTLPHDGNADDPKAKDNVDLISVCKKQKAGVCCGTLAEVLNECYLSMGFKSRRIVCLPKDSLGIDPDCHSIDAVYIDTLKKWVWMDPTFNAYVMNEKGELLSIEEVRERIINNKPLILNPDANWNNKFVEPKEEYFYNYMTKNLYKIRCFVGREKNSEGKIVPVSVELIPADGYKQKPDKVEDTSNYGFKSIIYRTNNPKLFWATPK